MYVPGQQRFEVFCVLRQWQPFQDVAQPCKGLTVIGFGGLGQGVDHDAGMRPGLGIGKQPALALMRVFA